MRDADASGLLRLYLRLHFHLMRNQILFLFVFTLFVGFAGAADYLETIQLPGNECLGSAAILRSGEVVAAGVDYTSSDILLFKLSSGGDV